MGNVHIFTGENLFELRQERQRWIQEFGKKHGEDNIMRLEGKDLTMRGLLDEICVAPFLSAKRLVVVDGLPKFAKGDVELIDRSIHEATILLIVHPKAGRRTPPKEVPDDWTVRQFPLHQRRQLLPWMDQWARQAGATFTPDAREKLVELVGDDQDLLSEEILKLAVNPSEGVITLDDVMRLAVPSSEGVVWRLTDDLCTGRRDKALKYAHLLLERGNDPFGLWAVLLGMLKNLVLVQAAVTDGRTDDMAQFGVHPFAVRSLMPYAKRVDRRALQAFLSQVVDADMALKTGGYRSTDEAPQELCALIDRFILTCP